MIDEDIDTDTDKEINSDINAKNKTETKNEIDNEAELNNELIDVVNKPFAYDNNKATDDDGNDNNNDDDNGNGSDGSKGNGGNNNGNGGRNRNNSNDVTIAELLVDLITRNSNLLFKDQYSVPFGYIHNDDHYEAVRLGSSNFKYYIGHLFYQNYSAVPNSDAVKSAIQLLQGIAIYQGETISLSLRVAWNNGDIYYDMTNDKWQAIKITKDGWQLTSLIRPIFTRFNQVAQVVPDRNYESDIFEKFFALTNIKDENDKLLLKVYIISLFIPEIPHVILVVHGPQGSAKTTFQMMIKLLIDPAKPKLLTVHKDPREFIQQLAHNYVAYYDNLKRVPEWFSAEVCKAVTGVGSTKRMLYSDDDDIVNEYMRCLGFSGINSALTEPDALDRSLLIKLDEIKKKNRRVEAEVLAEFDSLRPKLLAYIFDILTKAIHIKDTVKLDNLPRMADFTLWGEAVSRAMGYEDLKFINYYYENIGKQNIEAIESHSLGHVIIKYIADSEHQSLEGSPSEVLGTLERHASSNEMEQDIKNKYWPKSANSFVRRLREISSSLLDGVGIEVEITRTTKSNMAYVKIWKIPPEPPEPPEGQNQEGKPPDSAGDTLPAGDIIPPENEMPPEKDPESRAQNQFSGDTGDTGDICRTIEEDPPSPKITSDNEKVIPSNYEDKISREYLKSLSCWAYRCKEHPEVAYYSIEGIYISHFKPEHEN